jgi:hypothetical protein
VAQFTPAGDAPHPEGFANGAALTLPLIAANSVTFATRWQAARRRVVAVAEIADLTLKPAFISNFGRPLMGLRQTFGRV